MDIFRRESHESYSCSSTDSPRHSSRESPRNSSKEQRPSAFVKGPTRRQGINVGKRKRHYSGSSDEKDPELGLDGPSAKRQHILATVSCPQQNSDPSSSAPSSVFEDDRFVDYAQSELPTPDSPNSIDDGVALETASFTSFETLSTTSSVHSDSECEQSLKTTAHKKPIRDDYVDSFNCMTPVEPYGPRTCPLPALAWANASEVWNTMCKKDELAATRRDVTMLNNHPGLQHRMRAILLDWLIEVCEVYKLHRETYYLAVDYLDRYLSSQKNVQKTHLQLLGITCLFIAAKVEEIYPPKIAEFAYVTDGACQEEDILQYEMILLQALDWSISPVTAMGWLGIYMQLNISNRTPESLLSHGRSHSADKSASEEDNAFIYPQFSGMEFVQTAQLLDLCSLDVGIGEFSYSTIAAAAISHTFNKETAVRVSGFDWATIQPCAHWMEPFFKVVSEESEHLYLTEQNEQISSKCGLSHWCPNIVTDDSHIIQTHTISMAMFDRAYLINESNTNLEKTNKTEASPATGLKCPEGLLTPPASSRKPLDENDEEDDDEHRDQQLTSRTTSILPLEDLIT